MARSARWLRRTPIDPPFVGKFTFEVDGAGRSARSPRCPGCRCRSTSRSWPRAGRTRYTHKLLGRMKWPNLVLKRGLTDTDALFEWLLQCSGEGLAEDGNKVTAAQRQDQRAERGRASRCAPGTFAERQAGEVDRAASSPRRRATWRSRSWRCATVASAPGSDRRPLRRLFAGLMPPVAAAAARPVSRAPAVGATGRAADRRCGRPGGPSAAAGIADGCACGRRGRSCAGSGRSAAGTPPPPAPADRPARPGRLPQRSLGGSARGAGAGGRGLLGRTPGAASRGGPRAGLTGPGGTARLLPGRPGLIARARLLGGGRGGSPAGERGGALAAAPPDGPDVRPGHQLRMPPGPGASRAAPSAGTRAARHPPREPVPARSPPRGPARVDRGAGAESRPNGQRCGARRRFRCAGAGRPRRRLAGAHRTTRRAGRGRTGADRGRRPRRGAAGADRTCRRDAGRDRTGRGPVEPGIRRRRARGSSARRASRPRTGRAQPGAPASPATVDFRRPWSAVRRWTVSPWAVAWHATPPGAARGGRPCKSVTTPADAGRSWAARAGTGDHRPACRGSFRALGAATLPPGSVPDPSGAVTLGPAAGHRPGSPTTPRGATRDSSGRVRDDGRTPRERWEAAVAARPLEAPRPLPAAFHAWPRRSPAGRGRRCSPPARRPGTRSPPPARSARPPGPSSTCRAAPRPGRRPAVLAHELTHTRSPVRRPRFLLGGASALLDDDERPALAAGRAPGIGGRAGTAGRGRADRAGRRPGSVDRGRHRGQSAGRRRARRGRRRGHPGGPRRGAGGHGEPVSAARWPSRRPACARPGRRPGAPARSTGRRRWLRRRGRGGADTPAGDRRGRRAARRRPRSAVAGRGRRRRHAARPGQDRGDRGTAAAARDRAPRRALGGGVLMTAPSAPVKAYLRTETGQADRLPVQPGRADHHQVEHLERGGEQGRQRAGAAVPGRPVGHARRSASRWTPPTRARTSPCTPTSCSTC